MSIRNKVIPKKKKLHLFKNNPKANKNMKYTIRIFNEKDILFKGSLSNTMWQMLRINC